MKEPHALRDILSKSYFLLIKEMIDLSLRVILMVAFSFYVNCFSNYVKAQKP